MFSTLSRKRGHDEDEVTSLHDDKKLRRSAGHEHNDFRSHPFQSQPMTINSGNSSIDSTAVTSAESSDVEMDMDMEMDTSQTSSNMNLSSHSPTSQPSWSLQTPTLRNPRMALDNHGARIPTPSLSISNRPKPTPLQSFNPYETTSTATASATMRVRLSAHDRVPSPISEDEPHTPTTATGSQFSMLRVTDGDMDMTEELIPEQPLPPPEPTPAARVLPKQRARSGAFTSPRDPTKKFSMGYREDCEKCRDRVPGHMNHFLGF